MGNYISYDRKEAEGYARSLKKQQEREAAAREEKRIWDEFAAEQMRQEREKSASSGVSRTPRQPKPRAAKLTDRERGEDILRRALALLRSRTEKAVSICRAVPQNGKHAAVIRDLLDPDSVIWFGKEFERWKARAIKLMGDEAESVLAAEVAEAAARVRAAMDEGLAKFIDCMGGLPVSEVAPALKLDPCEVFS